MWLLLSLPAAALFWWLFTRWEVSDNFRAIQADGAKNSLRGAFHLQRTLLRLAAAVAAAGVGAGPAPAPGFWWLAAGQLAGFAGWFLYVFTPQLNLARGLAEYYVSSSPTSAWLDRLLWNRAVRAYPDFNAWNGAELHQNRRAYAAAELRTLLRAGLGAGGAAYAVAVVLALFLLKP